MISVLVLSKERSTCEMLGRMLGPSFRVEHMSGLGAALDLFATAPPEVTVVDERLADSDGLDAVEEIMRTYPEAILIYLISPTAPASAERARTLGVFGCLNEPLDPDRLEFMVEKAAEKADDRKKISYMEMRLRGPGELPPPEEIAAVSSRPGSRAAALETLKKLARAITSIKDLENLGRLVVEAVMDIFGSNSAVLILPDDKEGRIFKPCGACGISQYLLSRLTFTRGEGILRWLRENARLLRSSEVEKIADITLAAQIQTELAKLKAELVMPLMLDGRIVGALSAGHKLIGGYYSEDEMRMLVTVASLVSVAVENSLLLEKISSEQMLNRSILDNIGYGIIAVDSEGILATINPFAARVLDIDASEMRGNHMRGIPPRLAELLAQTLETGKGIDHEEVEDVAIRAPLSVSTSLLRNKSGEMSGAIMFFVDLSKIKDLETEVKGLEHVKFWSELSGRLAHELRNPLVSIKTFAQLLPERYSDADFRYNFHEMVRREVDRIDDIADQLITYSTPSTPRLEPGDIKEVIEESILSLAGELERKGIKVIRSLNNATQITMDAGQIKDALKRVMGNAVESIDGDGTLTVTLKKLSYDKIRSRPPSGVVFDSCDGGKDRQDFLEIEVKDTGRGMSKDMLEKIFVPLYSSKTQGMGLGLAIVKKIVEEHKGRIEVDSSEGKGTTFTIHLPL